MTIKVEFAFDRISPETVHGLVVNFYATRAVDLDLSGLVVGQWFRVKPRTYLPLASVYGAEALLLDRLGFLESVEVLLEAAEPDGFAISPSRRAILREHLLDRVASLGGAPMAVSSKNDVGVHPFVVGAVDRARAPKVLRECRVVLSRTTSGAQSWLPAVVTRSGSPQAVDFQIFANHLAASDDALIFHSGADDSLDFGLNVLTTPRRLNDAVTRWDDTPVFVDDGDQL